MDQHYTSAASKLEEILKTHKGRLSREKTYMSALIKELKDGVPRTKDVKAKFQFLEDALKKNEPAVWIQIDKIRNSLATDEMGTVRTESSTASPEPEARNDSKVKAHETELTKTIKDLEKTVENLKSLLVEKDEEIRSISRESSASYESVRGIGSASSLRSMSRASSTSYESVHGFGSTSTLRSEAEQACQLLDELYKQAAAVVEKTDTSTKTETTKGCQEKGMLQMKLESHQVNDKFKSVSSVLTEMGDAIIQVKKLKQENDYLAGLLEALHDIINGGEDKISEKQSSASPGNELSGFNHAIKILRTFQEKESQAKTLKEDKKFMVQLLDALHESVTGVEHNSSKNKPSAAPGTAPSRHELTTNILRTFQEKKNEAEYAACLLEELSKFSHATKNDDNGNILTPPQNVETSHDFKEKEDKNVDNSRRKTPQCTHDESLMKCYRCASHVLKNMKESERLRKDLGIKKGQIEDLMERLKHVQNKNTKLVKEADSLLTRLSEHAGALLHHDNPAIADLSNPNRATKLGEKYAELYDNQWTDAFSKLQTEYSSASDEELTGYLYKLLVDGYVFCADARHAQKFNLQEIMLNPTGDMTKSQIRPKEEVSKGFSNILTDAAKLSSNVASGNIAKAFLKDNGTMMKHGKRIQLCETYIQGCVELCWHMHVQTPPLCLDMKTTKGHAFERNEYKEYTRKGTKIAFVVWPALFLYENGPLVSKGIAQGD